MRRSQIGRKDIQLAVSSMVKACLAKSGLSYVAVRVDRSGFREQSLPGRSQMQVQASGEIIAEQQVRYQVECQLRRIGRGVRGQKLTLLTDDGRSWNFLVKQWWENGRCQTKAVMTS